MARLIKFVVAIGYLQTTLFPALSQAKLQGQVCTDGGYCSCEKKRSSITSYVDEASELKPVLEEAAFKKEVSLLSDAFKWHA